MLYLMFSRGHHDEMETENMNPEDIYNSIKQTTADIQNLSFHSKLESYDPVKKKREFTSQDSGIQDLRNDSPDAVDSRKGNYNPSQYSDEVRLALTIHTNTWCMIFNVVILGEYILWKISVLKFSQTAIDDFIPVHVKWSWNDNWILILSRLSKCFWILLGIQFLNNWKETVESIEFIEARLL